MGGLGKYLNGTGATSTQVPNVTDNSDPVIAGAARYLVKKYGSFQDIPITDQLLSFKYKGSTQLVLVGQYERDNLKIYITIVIPYSTFFADIQTSRRITIALTVIAAVFGVLRYAIAWRMMLTKKNKVHGNIPITSTTASASDSQISVEISNHSRIRASSAALINVNSSSTNSLSSNYSR